MPDWTTSRSVNSRDRVRALDLFCGAGGSSSGATRAGVSVVAAVDSWPLVEHVYKDNFPQTTFYRSKCESLSPARIKREIGSVDLIIASPECTSHTCAKGNGDRSEESKQTAFQVCRFASVLQPRWIVVENVVHMRSWTKYRRWLKRLERLGYRHREQVLDSADFGVPQSRKRLFVICDREQQPPEVVPPRIRHVRTAATILVPNGEYEFGPLRTKRRALRTLQSAERALTVVGYKRSFLVVYYGTDGGGGWQSLDAPLRTVTTLDRFALVRPSKRGHEMRMLQVPELRKAMGIPQSFKIAHGTRRDQIKMLGNGVCPPVMRAVVEALTGSGAR
jgi:DNA (cytosine-5)-methyltransferase 1